MFREIVMDNDWDNEFYGFNANDLNNNPNIGVSNDSENNHA